MIANRKWSHHKSCFLAVVTRHSKSTKGPIYRWNWFVKTARTACLARSQPHLNTQLYLNYKGAVRLASLTGDKCRSLSKCECMNYMYKDSITRDLIVKFLLTLGSITLLHSEQMSLMILDPKHQIESFKFQIWKKTDGWCLFLDFFTNSLQGFETIEGLEAYVNIKAHCAAGRARRQWFMREI